MASCRVCRLLALLFLASACASADFSSVSTSDHAPPALEGAKSFTGAIGDRLTAAVKTADNLSKLLGRKIGEGSTLPKEGVEGGKARPLDQAGVPNLAEGVNCHICTGRAQCKIPRHTFMCCRADLTYPESALCKYYADPEHDRPCIGDFPNSSCCISGRMDFSSSESNLSVSEDNAGPSIKFGDNTQGRSGEARPQQTDQYTPQALLTLEPERHSSEFCATDVGDNFPCGFGGYEDQPVHARCARDSSDNTACESWLDGRPIPTNAAFPVSSCCERGEGHLHLEKGGKGDKAQMKVQMYPRRYPGIDCQFGIGNNQCPASTKPMCCESHSGGGTTCLYDWMGDLLPCASSGRYPYPACCPFPPVDLMTPAPLTRT